MIVLKIEMYWQQVRMNFEMNHVCPWFENGAQLIEKGKPHGEFNMLILLFSLLIWDIMPTGHPFWVQVGEIHDIGSHECGSPWTGYKWCAINYPGVWFSSLVFMFAYIRNLFCFSVYLLPNMFIFGFYFSLFSVSLLVMWKLIYIVLDALEGQVIWKNDNFSHLNTVLYMCWQSIVTFRQYWSCCNALRSKEVQYIKDSKRIWCEIWAYYCP